MQISDLSILDRNDGKNLGKIVKAKNSLYLFAIQQSGKGNDSVTTIEPTNSAKGKDLWESELKSNTPLAMLLAGSRVGGIALGSFVSSPRFHLLSIDELDNPKLLKVSFTYDFEETESFPFEYEASYFICDPSNNYFISESEYNALEGTKRSKVQYKESMTPGVACGGVTLTRSIVRTIKIAKGTIDTLKGNSETSLELNPKVFYLSYYGFPEPNFKRGYTVWLWAGAASVVAFLWYYVRRRSKKGEVS